MLALRKPATIAFTALALLAGLAPAARTVLISSAYAADRGDHGSDHGHDRGGDRADRGDRGDR